MIYFWMADIRVERRMVRSLPSRPLLQTSATRPHLKQLIVNNRDHFMGGSAVPMRTTTNVSSSSTISVTVLNNRCTSLPDSENHRENSECELISISREWGYLYDKVTLSDDMTTINPKCIYLSDRRMDSFWASARHSDVFPVPGGPCSSTTRFQDTILTGVRAIRQTYVRLFSR